MKSWLRIMRVGLCAAAVVETLLWTASVATTDHKKAPARPHKKASARPHKKAGEVRRHGVRSET
jgi:hypothetical protein